MIVKVVGKPILDFSRTKMTMKNFYISTKVIEKPAIGCVIHLVPIKLSDVGREAPAATYG